MTEIKSTKIVIDGIEHKFFTGTYNGMAVIYDNFKQFINASSFCSQFKTKRNNNKRFVDVARGDDWNEFVDGFEEEYYPEAKNTNIANSRCWSYVLHKGIPDDFKQLRGTYVDSRMINYIAIKCSPKYAVMVSKIMDAINKRVHDELTAQSKPDTIENAKPVFEKVVKSFIDEANKKAQLNYERTSCWGCRDMDINEKAWGI